MGGQHERELRRVFGPMAATPPAIVQKLHRETMKALQEPRLRARLLGMGLEPMELTPAQFDAFVRSEIALNAVPARRAGLKPE